MKKTIILIFLCVYALSGQSQSNLYLIFYENTSDVVKDIHKYYRVNHPAVATLDVGKFDTYVYHYGYPLINGLRLTFRKKEGTSLQVFPMATLAISYPDAMTIAR